LYAQHYWLVDPVELTLEAFKLDGERWVELGSWDHRACVRIEPFTEIEIGRLFPPGAADAQ
jgi:hypothetical protein